MARDQSTALMPRDELLGLVNATAAAAVTAHAVPRVLLGSRERSGDDTTELDEPDRSSIVLGILFVLIAMFTAILMTAH